MGERDERDGRDERDKKQREGNSKRAGQGHHSESAVGARRGCCARTMRLFERRKYYISLAFIRRKTLCLNDLTPPKNEYSLGESRLSVSSFISNSRNVQIRSAT